MELSFCKAKVQIVLILKLLKDAVSAVTDDSE
jgi:hypothetical protein